MKRLIVPGILGAFGVATLVSIIVGAVVLAVSGLENAVLTVGKDPRQKELAAEFLKEWDRYVSLGLPTRLEELEPPIPDSENRAVAVQAAATSIAKVRGDKAIPSDPKELETAVKEIEPYLQKVIDTYQKPELKWWAKTDWNKGIWEESRANRGPREVGRFLPRLSLVQAREGRPTVQVLRTLGASFLLSRDVGQNGAVLSFMAGEAIHRQTLTAAREIAMLWQSYPEKLKSLEALLVKHPPQVDLLRSLTYMTYTTISWTRGITFVEFTKLDLSMLALKESDPTTSIRKKVFDGPPEDERFQASLADYFRRFNDFVVDVRQNGITLQALKNLDGVQSTSRTYSTPLEGVGHRVSNDAVGLHNAQIRLKTQHLLSLVAIKVAEFHGKQGSYPSSMSDLEFSETDPFAPGKPFQLKRTEQGVEIYSVGENGIDDGGKSETKERTDDVYVLLPAP